MRKRACLFCTDNKQPDYKETIVLKRFITERGKIVPRLKSGVCAPHQRKLASAIKRARGLALLQFAPQV